MYGTETKLQITPETKVGELLENYPELEEVLIALAPPFKNLKNPVLRKTVAKITSLRQAALVGNINISQMINDLRKAAGYGQVNCEEHSCREENFSINEDKIVMTYDARRDLESGVVPAMKVMNDLKELNRGEIYKMITPFLPAPLIDKARDKGYKAYCRQDGKEYFETFFLASEQA